MYSPNNTASPFNTQTELVDFTAYGSQAPLKQMITVSNGPVTTNAALCLNWAYINQVYQRKPQPTLRYS